MNAAQRKTYWKDYEALRAALEKRFVLVINKCLTNQVSSFTTRLLKRGMFVSRDLDYVSGKEMTLTLIALHVYSAIKNGKRVHKILKQQIKGKGLGVNVKWTKDVLKYMNEQDLRLVKNITNTTRQRLKQQMEQGIQEGKGIEEIAKGMQDDAINKFRALRIARTETMRATNFGNFLAAGELDIVTEKKWVATHDAKTRESHIELDGEVKGMDEDFKPGLSFPGDPNAEPEETINCRCTIAFVPVRDSSGALISPSHNEPLPTDVARVIEELPTQSIDELIDDILRRVVEPLITSGEHIIDKQVEVFIVGIFAGLGMEEEIKKVFKN